MKKGGLVLGLILIGVLLVSLGFVSASTVDEHCPLESNQVGYYYTTSDYDFHGSQRDTMSCRALPAGVTALASQTSTVYLVSAASTSALCPANYVAYGFACDPYGDKDCAMGSNPMNVYCVNLSGNAPLTYYDTAFNTMTLSCGSDYLAGFYNHPSDSHQMKARCVHIAAAGPVCTPPSNTVSGDHCGQDWIISSNTNIAGVHTNIRNFVINSGITATVQPFDGTNYGSVEIHAQNINITGTLDASGKGFGGGGGGGALPGIGGNYKGTGYESDPSGGIFGYGGAGSVGGLTGSNPTYANFGASPWQTGYSGGGGKGGGVCGGTGGTSVSINRNEGYFETGPCAVSPSAGVIRNGGSGSPGTYSCAGLLDTNDENVWIGSGGAGGAGGTGSYIESMCNTNTGGGGGGAGGTGGGAVKLYATNKINIDGNLYSKGFVNGGNGGDGGGASAFCDSYGNGGNGGSASVAGTSAGGSAGICSGSYPFYYNQACYSTNYCFRGGTGGNGGAGSGGGILIYANNLNITGTIDNRGGGSITNGGTLKIFCGISTAINPAVLQSTTGRLYVDSSCGSLISFDSNSWTNLKGIVISSSQVGDTVRMVAGGLLGLGSDITYTVYKNTTYWWFLHTVKTLSSTSSSDLWTSSEPWNGVYFKAQIANVENISSTIDIVSANNALPIANITSPVKGFLWSVNTSLGFSQQSYDEDDLLKLEWNFGDNSVNQIINNYSYINTSAGNVVHNFTKGGVYNVKLTAQEMIRTQSDEDSIKVYILQPGINVVPIISNPEDGVSLGNFRIVSFNASTSYVANCTNYSNPYPCSDTSKQFIPPPGNILKCCYIHAPNTRNYLTNNYNITMNWTLTTEGSSEIIREYGDWSSRYNNVVEFTELFGTQGRHTAYLDMSFELK